MATGNHSFVSTNAAAPRASPDYTLCLVTDQAARYPQGLLTHVEAAVAGGVTWVQFRATSGTKKELYRTACALRDLLQSLDVPLIINDHVDLALAVGADGAHVGQNDLPVTVARKLLGRDRLLGLSITDPSKLDDVDFADVDYLGVGPVFPTTSKADAAPDLGLERLAAIVACSLRPVVAIGGISVGRIPAVFATGAAGVAVVSALSTASDATTAARALRTAWSARS
jgi:thiamine-phosphate pyrophosphorylase